MRPNCSLSIIAIAMLSLLACSADQSEESTISQNDGEGDTSAQEKPADNTAKAEEYQSIVKIIPSTEEKTLNKEVVKFKPTEEEIAKVKLAKKAIIVSKPATKAAAKLQPTKEEIAKLKLSKKAIVAAKPREKAPTKDHGEIKVAAAIAPAKKVITELKSTEKAIKVVKETITATKPVKIDTASIDSQRPFESETQVAKAEPLNNVQTPAHDAPAEKIIYIVRSGNSLAGIAGFFGIKIQQLKKWNRLNSNMIHPGQKLVVYTRMDRPADNLDRPNGAITYVVRPGSTLAGIARSFGITIQRLKEWNSLTSHMIYPGQKLLIHNTKGGKHIDTPPSSPANALNNPNGKITYIVRSGNTIAGIAGIFQIKAHQIKKWNKLNSNMLRRGQKLVINIPESIKPASYKVKKGDTLSAVSLRLGVNQEELMYINGIRNAANLRIGQKLVYYQRAG